MNVTSPLTSERIKCYQRSINALPSSTLRPTEGQLRYLQFRFPHKAKATKARIRKLFQALHIINLKDVSDVTDRDIAFATNATAGILLHVVSNESSSSSVDNDYGGLMFENYDLKSEDEVLSDAYKVILAVSARKYVERCHLGDRQHRYKWASVFGYDEDGEEERVKRFQMTKDSAVWQKMDENSARRQLFVDNEAAAENARKWAKGLSRQTVDSKDYYDMQRAPLHTYKSNFSLFAKEHVNGIDHNVNESSFWLYQHERYANDQGDQASSHKSNNKQVPETTFQSPQDPLISTTPVKIVDMLKDMQKKTGSPTKPRGRDNLREEFDSSKWSASSSSSPIRPYSPVDTSDSKTELINGSITSQEEQQLDIIKNPNLSSVSSELERSEISSQTEHLCVIHDKSIEISNDDNRRLSEKVLDKLLIKSPGEKLSDSPGSQNVSSSFSPTRLTRLHQEVLYAAKMHRWDEVEKFLIDSKWVAKMTDILTGQLLMHQMALHGATAPIMLIDLLYDCYPSGVHKFDIDGNLPLHMACSAGNLHMASLLLIHFEGGASVRNIDGLLPLHFAAVSGSRGVVDLLLNAFPSGVGVCDNEGNLPLHFGASLEGVPGRDVVSALLTNDLGVSLDNMKRNQKIMSTSQYGIENMNTNRDEVNCENISSLLVCNSDNNTPLMVAIRAISGWEVVETLLDNHNGHLAAKGLDKEGCSPLHHLLGRKCSDPASILVLLRKVPQCIFITTKDGILPIEIACRNNISNEIILALVLLDLPFDLDDRNLASGLKNGYGFNWNYVVSKASDKLIEIIEKVLSTCSYHQVRELCFFRDGKESASAITLASPKVKEVMRKALRFIGRFEFVNGDVLFTDLSIGLQIFDAMDFGPKTDPYSTPHRVTLRCYGDEHTCFDDTLYIRTMTMDFNFLERASYFRVRDYETTSPQQFCVAIERPNFTLSKLLTGLQNASADASSQAAFKLSMVLRSIGKSVRYLHSLNIIHGNICLDSCGKFGNNWKLMQTTGLTSTGHTFQASSRPNSIQCLPPELIHTMQSHNTIVASASIDIWSYGVLLYETFMNRPLYSTLDQALTWSTKEVACIVEDLIMIGGVDASGADLISQCLSPSRLDRPVSMIEVLDHPYWSILRKKKQRSTGKSRFLSYFSRSASNFRTTNDELGEI